MRWVTTPTCLGWKPGNRTSPWGYLFLKEIVRSEFNMSDYGLEMWIRVTLDATVGILYRTATEEVTGTSRTSEQRDS